MAKIKTLVIASGYFNPLHKGHIEYLKRSRELGDSLIVIINNDMQVGLKGSKPFQNELERKDIMDELKCVNYSLISIDDDRSVKRSIEFIYKFIKADKYIFTNGGDQFGDTILEKDLCKQLGIELVDGLGEKIQSSSELKNKL
jgi:D-beta-D-heptose 7-phosphate kinase/D-beta-D-heptose 1-phosphate adenosyltransferase